MKLSIPIMSRDGEMATVRIELVDGEYVQVTFPVPCDRVVLPPQIFSEQFMKMLRDGPPTKPLN